MTGIAVSQPRRRRITARPAHQQQPPGLHERPLLPAEQTTRRRPPHQVTTQPTPPGTTHPVPGFDIPERAERERLHAALHATNTETGFWDDNGRPRLGRTTSRTGHPTPTSAALTPQSRLSKDPRSVRIAFTDDGTRHPHRTPAVQGARPLTRPPRLGHHPRRTLTRLLTGRGNLRHRHRSNGLSRGSTSSTPRTYHEITNHPIECAPAPSVMPQRGDFTRTRLTLSWATSIDAVRKRLARHCHGPFRITIWSPASAIRSDRPQL